jgi:hypothetical protein
VVTLAPASAALIGTNVELAIHSKQPKDVLIRISPRLERDHLLCIGLGDSKVEVALWRDRQSPPIRWFKFTPKTHEIREVLVQIKKQVESWLAAKRPEKPVRVAVSWPGPAQRAAFVRP